MEVFLIIRVCSFWELKFNEIYIHKNINIAAVILYILEAIMMSLMIYMQFSNLMDENEPIVDEFDQVFFAPN